MQNFNNGFVFSKTKLDEFKQSFPDRFSMEMDMESLIHHFKLGTEGFLVEKEEVYCSFEAPKGETSVYLALEEDVSNIPWRVRLRAPGFLIWALCQKLLEKC